MVVEWMFGSVGCLAMSKDVELSYDLDYVILFWSWVLSPFCGNIHVPWVLLEIGTCSAKASFLLCTFRPIFFIN